MEKAKLKVSLTLIKKYTIRLDINTLAELNQCTLNSNDHYMI